MAVPLHIVRQLYLVDPELTEVAISEPIARFTGTEVHAEPNDRLGHVTSLVGHIQHFMNDQDRQAGRQNDYTPRSPPPADKWIWTARPCGEFLGYPLMVFDDCNKHIVLLDACGQVAPSERKK